MIINKELKKCILIWLMENENVFNRLNGCIEYFRLYIYTPEGQFLIGGEDVYNYIKELEKLI